MEFFKFIPLAAAVTNLGLAVFIAARGFHVLVNRVYFLWGLSLFIWNIGTFFMFVAGNAEEALFWARFLQFGVIFLPAFLYHLNVLVAQISSRGGLKWFYLITAGFAVSNLFSGLFIKNVSRTHYGYYSSAGPLFWAWLAVYIFLALKIWVLLMRKRKTLQPLQRRRLNMMVFATEILMLFGTNDLLPILGLEHYPGTEWQIYPWGSAAAIVYGMIIGYSVIQEQFLNVNIALSRSAAQLVRLVFLILIGFFLLVIGAMFGPDQGGYTFYSFIMAMFVLVATLLIAAFVFPKLLGTGDELLERRLLGDNFEYHDRVKSLAAFIKAHPEPEAIMPELQRVLITVMQIRGYQVIVLDENTKSFSLLDSYPAKIQSQMPDLSLESPIFKYFDASGSRYLSRQTGYALPGENSLFRSATDQLKKFSGDVCIPLKSRGEVFGIFIFDGKNNREPFTPHDLTLLVEVVDNLGLLLNQIRLQSQIQSAQEQEMLGRMSRGLAHDMNNLLTPVQTVFQLIDSGLGGKEDLGDLLQVATRNIGIIRNYINEALFFSRTHSLQLKPCGLGEVIRNAIGLLEAEIQKKQLLINFSCDDLCPAEIDEVMIQRLLCNLISNAIDASKAGSSLHIQVGRLPKTEAHRDWYRIHIIDSGEGIKPENLKRIFMPYFSTKNTGDRRRGFGLGLAIAKKIVTLHGGNLSIESTEGEGTTVLIDLPSRSSFKPEKVNAKLVAEFAA